MVRPIAVVVALSLGLGAAAQERRLPPAGAERRAALVVGNDSYAGMALRNARNDAKAMAAVLAQLGFEVTTALDTDRVSLERTIRTFIGKLGTAEVGLFFYAGHGVQIEGENYLVPVDFDAQDEPEAKAKAYPVDLLRTKMDSSGARLKVIVLDACRDNPFRFARSGSRGLIGIEPARGTLIAYATGPGKTASDNATSGNGLFTQSLLEQLKQPGLKVQDVFDRARVAVDEASGGSQTPWVNSNIIGEFYLGAAPSQVGAAGSTEVELTYWTSIKDSRNVRDFEAYLAEYPSGKFAALARNRIDELRGASQPAASPAPGTVEREYWDTEQKVLKREYEYIAEAGRKVRHGFERRYYRSGALEYEATRRQNAFDGVMTRYWENGARFDVATYVAGSRNGPYEAYFHDGHPRARGQFKGGRKVGPWVTWYGEGVKESEGSYLADVHTAEPVPSESRGTDEIDKGLYHGIGAKTGRWRYWYRTAHKRIEETYDDEGKTTSASGALVGARREWYDNPANSLKSEQAPSGSSISYYENGQLESRCSAGGSCERYDPEGKRIQ